MRRVAPTDPSGFTTHSGQKSRTAATCDDRGMTAPRKWRHVAEIRASGTERSFACRAATDCAHARDRNFVHVNRAFKSLFLHMFICADGSWITDSLR
jgi:hypothetical protein